MVEVTESVSSADFKEVLPLFLVKVRCTGHLGENTAAVCMLHPRSSLDLRQKIAQTLRVSETVFILNRDWTDIYGSEPITIEVHNGLGRRMSQSDQGVLAVAHVLLNELDVTTSPFFMVHGDMTISVKKLEDEISVEHTTDEAPSATLAFPHISMEEQPITRVLLSNLGVTSYTGTYSAQGGKSLIIILPTEEYLSSIEVHSDRLRRTFDNDNVERIFLTAAATGEADYAVRSFSLWDRDIEAKIGALPHVVMAPFWSARLSKKTLRALYPREGAEVKIELSDEKHIILNSSGHTYFRGELFTKGYRRSSYFSVS